MAACIQSFVSSLNPDRMHSCYYHAHALLVAIFHMLTADYKLNTAHTYMLLLVPENLLMYVYAYTGSYSVS